jgi:hypothetical protein
MSINQYTNETNDYLLNHDDVIGTRSVSFIIYLVDEDWKPEWGGGLALHDTQQPGSPYPEPHHIIPPKFNQLVMFKVNIDLNRPHTITDNDMVHDRYNPDYHFMLFMKLRRRIKRDSVSPDGTIHPHQTNHGTVYIKNI